MKGGVAAMAYAIALLAKLAIHPPGDVVFAGVIGEEYEGIGTRHLVSHHRDLRLAIVGEPTNLKIAVAHKGIEWMEVAFTGRSVHSSRPEQGINAVYAATEFIRDLRHVLEAKLAGTPHPLLGRSLVNVGVIQGGVQPNVIPANCRIEVERRWNPGETLEALYAEVEAIAKDVASRSGNHVDITRMPYSQECERPPLDTPDDHPLVRSLQRSLDAWGEPVGPPVGIPFCTDGPTLARAGIPTVIFGPGDAGNAHSATEHIEIDDLVKAARAYAAVPFTLPEV